MTGFFLSEGFDIGAGMLQRLIGRTDAERRTAIAAIGPLWSWGEVWLIAFGGTLLFAFPSVLAVSFAGFYLALFLLLWALILSVLYYRFVHRYYVGKVKPRWIT